MWLIDDTSIRWYMYARRKTTYIDNAISTYYSKRRQSARNQQRINAWIIYSIKSLVGIIWYVYARSEDRAEPWSLRWIEQLARRVYVHGKQTINNNDCSSINNINNISIYNLSSLLWSSFFLFFHLFDQFIITITINVSVFRRIFSFIWYLYKWQ